MSEPREKSGNRKTAHKEPNVTMSKTNLKRKVSQTAPKMAGDQQVRTPER